MLAAKGMGMDAVLLPLIQMIAVVTPVRLEKIVSLLRCRRNNLR